MVTTKSCKVSSHFLSFCLCRRSSPCGLDDLAMHMIVVFANVFSRFTAGCNIVTGVLALSDVYRQGCRLVTRKVRRCRILTRKGSGGVTVPATAVSSVVTKDFASCFCPNTASYYIQSCAACQYIRPSRHPPQHCPAPSSSYRSRSGISTSQAGCLDTTDNLKCFPRCIFYQHATIDELTRVESLPPALLRLIRYINIQVEVAPGDDTTSSWMV